MQCYKIEYTEHKEGGQLWVGPGLRLCVECPPNKAVRTIDRFKLDHRTDMFSTICEDCIRSIRVQEAKQRELKVLEKEADAAETMSTALRKLQEVSKKTGNGFGDFFEGVCVAAGGRENVANLTGKVIKKSLSLALEHSALPSAIDRGVKVSEQIIKAAATEQKTKKPVNWRDITEDEQREILLEPAKTLALNDKRFRQELLNDPEVRKALLSNVGVEVIEQPETEEDDES